MLNRDNAFAGTCSCGRPCYGQSICDTCDTDYEREDEEQEEKVLCYICEDEEVKHEGDACACCQIDAAEFMRDQRKEEGLL